MQQIWAGSNGEDGRCKQSVHHLGNVGMGLIRGTKWWDCKRCVNSVNDQPLILFYNSHLGHFARQRPYTINET